MGKSTISMAIFNSFLYVYQRVMIVHAYWPSILDGRRHFFGGALVEHQKTNGILIVDFPLEQTKYHIFWDGDMQIFDGQLIWFFGIKSKNLRFWA